MMTTSTSLATGLALGRFEMRDDRLGELRGDGVAELG